jgi:hypothetical protein
MPSTEEGKRYVAHIEEACACDTRNRANVDKIEQQAIKLFVSHNAEAVGMSRDTLTKILLSGEFRFAYEEQGAAYAADLLITALATLP